MSDIAGYMEDCRGLAIEEIRRIMPADHVHSGGLYGLMLDYPLRPAKGLRPALCIATCRALGGHLEAVLPSAAVLELYHNAFLIHDDVEDGSEKRRREDTLHRMHGVPVAVNVGDGMLALTMEPLLANMEQIGLGRALRILKAVARMARESAEGQMMELAWIRASDWAPSDRDYMRMVYKKSAWYSFLTPMLVGAITAGADAARQARFAWFATLLGVAFQIQDDVLNLVAEEREYGKEIDGDLWEGKHTLILIHAMRAATPAERERALETLARPRAEKTHEGVRHLRALIDRHGSVAYAWSAAERRARRAARQIEGLAKDLAPSTHRDFLAGLAEFVVQRSR